MKNAKRNGYVFGMYSILAVALFSFLFFSFAPLVSSGVGETVVVKTSLEVGEVYPEILSVTINNDVNVTLTPNATTTVVCQAIVQDWNNDTDIQIVNSTLYDISTSTWDGSDDANIHYTNSSCVIDLDASNSWVGQAEDPWHAVANCSFEVEYYANATIWNCSVYVEDNTSRSNREEGSGAINEMLAVGLPDSVDFGVVNSTDVSSESQIDVENVGNVEIDLTIHGYDDDKGSDFMNCSRGSSPVIPIDYGKYNFTASTVGDLSLSEFEQTYTNLTTVAVTEQFDLSKRVVARTTKPTYFRVYVPKGTAGTCEGNLEFSAVKSL